MHGYTKCKIWIDMFYMVSVNSYDSGIKVVSVKTFDIHFFLISDVNMREIKNFKCDIFISREARQREIMN